MNTDVLSGVVPCLALLVYLLVQSVLAILAARRKNAIELHDRIREARTIRNEYLESIEQRGDFDVEEPAG